MKLSALPQATQIFSSLSSSIPSATPTAVPQTRYVEQRLSEIGGSTYTEAYAMWTVPGIVVSNLVEVLPVTSPIALSTTTITESQYASAVTTFVQILLASGSGQEISQSVNNGNDRSSGNGVSNTGSDIQRATPTIEYLLNVVYTLLQSCHQRFDYTTGITFTMTPSTTATLPALTTKPFTESVWYATYTGQMIMLDATAVPSEIYSSVSSDNIPNELNSCYTPTTSCESWTRIITIATAEPSVTTTIDKACSTWLAPTTAADWSTSTSQKSDSDPDDWYERWVKRRNIGIIAACVGATLMLIGLMTLSYINFSALMRGKRNDHCEWLYPNYSAPPVWNSRSAEDQADLKCKWNALTTGQRLKRWIKWGFKNRYPVEWLGEEPERVGFYWTRIAQRRDEREYRQRQRELRREQHEERQRRRAREEEQEDLERQQRAQQQQQHRQTLHEQQQVQQQEEETRRQQQESQRQQEEIRRQRSPTPPPPYVEEQRDAER